MKYRLEIYHMLQWKSKKARWKLPLVAVYPPCHEGTDVLGTEVFLYLRSQSYLHFLFDDLHYFY